MVDGAGRFLFCGVSSRVALPKHHQAVRLITAKYLIRSKSTASGGETPKGSAVSGVNLGRSSVRKAPVGQEDRHERLAEPIPREVGL